MLRIKMYAILFLSFTANAYAQTNYVDLRNGSSAAGLNDPVLLNASCSEFDGYGGPVPNTPFGNWYAAVLTIGNSNRGVQLVHGYPQYDELYFRGGTDGWHTWRKILSDANISSFALPLTGGMITGTVQIQKGIGATIIGNATYGNVIGSNHDGYELNLHGGIPKDFMGNGGGMIRLGGPARGDNDINVIQFLQNGTERMRIQNGGNVCIGTTDAKGYKLAVNGDAIFTKVKVKLYSNWPDYVFHSGYRLRPLSEVEQYIQQHHHLPEVPSVVEVKKDGLDLGGNQALLLKKIEELTLYVIEQDKQIKQLKKEIKSIQLILHK